MCPKYSTNPNKHGHLAVMGGKLALFGKFRFVTRKISPDPAPEKAPFRALVADRSWIREAGSSFSGICKNQPLIALY